MSGSNSGWKCLNIDLSNVHKVATFLSKQPFEIAPSQCHHNPRLLPLLNYLNDPRRDTYNLPFHNMLETFSKTIYPMTPRPELWHQFIQTKNILARIGEIPLITELQGFAVQPPYPKDLFGSSGEEGLGEKEGCNGRNRGLWEKRIQKFHFPS